MKLVTMYRDEKGRFVSPKNYEAKAVGQAIRDWDKCEAEAETEVPEEKHILAIPEGAWGAILFIGALLFLIFLFALTLDVITRLW